VTSDRRPGNTPLQRRRQPLLPPGQRSGAALILATAAGEGRFALPRCTSCGRFAWPVPELCPHCLGDIALAPAPRGATLLSATHAEAPADPYFRERAPWRVGLVQMDAGPSALVHLHPTPKTGARLRLTLMLDRARQAVLHAGPDPEEATMPSDPQWLEMVADPRGRRVLITDARHFAAPALTEALIGAGAAEVVLGLPDTGQPFAGRAALLALPRTRIENLDLVSDRSVQQLADQIADKVDILVNTADVLRPGTLFGPDTPAAAGEAMETVAFGLLRLARAFGPVMAARGAEGAVAWVNLLSVYAHAHPPNLAGYGMAHAAALTMSQALCAELATGGVRLLTVLTGPTEDDGFQQFPPPRVTDKSLAAAILDGLRRGLEEVVVGDVARDLMTRHAEDPRALQRELAQGKL